MSIFRLNKTKKVIVFLLTIIPFVLFGQKDQIFKYIPEENSSFETHPIITIKTIIHIIQKSKNDPQNLTIDSLGYLDQQFKWINNIYKDMSKPTYLPNDKVIYYVPDSRIRIKVDSIIFHIDSVGWNRIYMGNAMNSGSAWKIQSLDIEKNEIVIKGNYTNILKAKGDSIIIGGSSSNDGVYHPLKIFSKQNKTFIKLKEMLSNDIPDGSITYFKKVDKNCHKDNWENIAKSDKNALHIFYTGSTIDVPSFGCGPSPFYLNISRVYKNGGYASAQLIAHEIGHCLGLRHTDFPQFNDLSPNDKFGWIPCNSTNTSNNIMGYNLCRNYLSPKQIGYIHFRYSTDHQLIKLTVNGKYDKTKSIKVWGNETWNKAMLVSGDIIIKSGATLKINKMVSMADNAKIYIENKANLIIDGASITNNHGKKWGGIVICKNYLKKNKKPCKKKNYGQIELINNGKLDNLY